jgi:SNF2 family DNA or RNA helicase
MNFSDEDFPFKYPPYEHQHKVFKTSRHRKAFALLMDMGTGKTKVTIDTAAWLFNQGRINGMLIVAPKGVYGNWASNELPKHMPDFIADKMTVVKWQGNHKAKYFLEKLRTLFIPDPLSLHVFIINIEALNTKPGVDICVKFLLAHDAMMVVDESTIIKHHTTKWTDKVVRLGRGAKYRRILTGTPITNSPLDVYTQFEFLDPEILGHSSFFSFRNRYGLLRKRTVNGKSFQQVVGYQRLNELQEKMQTAAIIIRKDECLDLPPKIYMPHREVEMSEKQRKMYDSLKKLSIAELEGKGFVTVTMALTKLLRLHQIVCGFVTIDEYEDLQSDMNGKNISNRRMEEIDPNGGPRMAELLSTLDEVSGKGIIWANYTHNIQSIARHLGKAYGSDSVAIYAGQTPQEERELIVKRFQDPKDPLRWFVGQTRTGGFGLTLTQAKTVIYYSNDYNLETRLQSEDRAHRIGQDSSVVYIDLICPKTIDEKIIQVLKNKESLAQQVTRDGWKNLFNDD